MLLSAAELADDAAALADDRALLAEVSTGPGARGMLEETTGRMDTLLSMLVMVA